MSKKIALIVSLLTSVSISVTVSSALGQEAQDCSAICGQYQDYAKKAGAPETFANLQRLYNACMRCKSHQENSQFDAGSYECKEGKFAMWIEGNKYCVEK